MLLNWQYKTSGIRLYSIVSCLNVNFFYDKLLYWIILLNDYAEHNFDHIDSRHSTIKSFFLGYNITIVVQKQFYKYKVCEFMIWNYNFVEFGQYLNKYL